MAERVSNLFTNTSLTELYSEKLLKRLVGRTDMEDALKRLDKLTQEEARMAIAENLKIISVVSSDVRVKATDKETGVIRSEQLIFPSATSGASCVLLGIQMQESFLKWLSPPDPSVNHNIACKARQVGTSEWFFQNDTFCEWEFRGSLLWILGKRISILLSPLFVC